MKVLSVEESKKVATKFLRRLNDFDQQGVDLYFDHKISWIKRLFWKLGWRYLSGSIFCNCDLYYFDDRVDDLRPFYESNIEFSRIKLNNFQKEFLQALNKSLDKKMIYGQYLDSKLRFENIDYERRLVGFTAGEIMNVFDLFNHNSLYLFTDDDDFCFYNNGEVITFSGSQNFMLKFRNNFPHVVDCIFTDDMIRRPCCGFSCK